MRRTNMAAAFLGLATLIGAGGVSCTHTTAPSSMPAATAPTAVYTGAEVAKFKTLATAAMTALGAGNKVDASARMAELETAWDGAENALGPRNDAVWKGIDEALDKAKEATDGGNVDEAKADIGELLEKLDAATIK